ncbi:hypothetical protein ACQ10A_15805, partial [Enterococcus faecalis]|uniref:hypothetical protein n=1 Tax=Enterococcus faecalis TaxID=1351 RepID=UPI003D6A0430
GATFKQPGIRRLKSGSLLFRTLLCLAILINTFYSLKVMHSAENFQGYFYKRYRIFLSPSTLNIYVDSFGQSNDFPFYAK